MMKSIIHLKYMHILLSILMLSSSSCQTKDKSLNDDFNMTVSELIEAIKNDSSLVILDVRMPRELTGQHSQINDVINIPVQELNRRFSEMNQYKENNIAVICRSGNRSVFATKFLQSKGFKAKNVLGGMIAFNRLK